MGRSTFYKYVNKLGLYTRKRGNKKDDYHPIISKNPNEYWHIDTTYYSLLKDVSSVAIAFASDNFSRMITGFEISIHNNNKNILSVLKQTVQTILKYHPDHIDKVKLVNDGGSENNNQFVSDFIDNLKLPLIEQLIAKKTIKSSNSSIEAINKIYKIYLRHIKPQTLNELKIKTEEFVFQYNFLRPHGSLNGQTPFEVYTLQDKIDYSDSIKNARKERILKNQQNTCKLCS
jgi:transposase InsO family protein